MEFKVGDIVVGNARATYYYVTVPGWVGVVVEADTLTIKVKRPGDEDHNYYEVNANCFDLDDSHYFNKLVDNYYEIQDRQR